MNLTKKILIQLDCDRHPSSFDSVVAIDGGADVLQTYSHVEVDDVESIIHGAIFTRKITDLKSTAVFFGGNQVNQAELLMKKAKSTFFGPMKVSLMLDAAGANTTSAAAVLSVQQYMDLSQQTIAVFAATGSVGNRVCRLLGEQSVNVMVASRSLANATQLCEDIRHEASGGTFVPTEVKNAEQTAQLLSKVSGVFSTGAAGIQLISKRQLDEAQNLKFAVDLNAVPPTGIESVEANDFGEQRGHVLMFGAIGVGGLKMKIHRRCIEALFESNEHVLDLSEIYDVGRQLVESKK